MVTIWRYTANCAITSELRKDGDDGRVNATLPADMVDIQRTCTNCANTSEFSNAGELGRANGKFTKFINIKKHGSRSTTSACGQPPGIRELFQSRCNVARFFNNSYDTLAWNVYSETTNAS